jgi:hypothetical protein
MLNDKSSEPIDFSGLHTSSMVNCFNPSPSSEPSSIADSKWVDLRTESDGPRETKSKTSRGNSEWRGPGKTYRDTMEIKGNVDTGGVFYTYSEYTNLFIFQQCEFIWLYPKFVDFVLLCPHFETFL